MLHSIATVASIAAAVAASALAFQGGGGKPLLQETERLSARVVYFGGSGVAGEYAIDYGRPDWSSEYDQDFDQRTRGERHRLGKDMWSSLDTQVPLEIGGKELKPGLYYLALERSEKGDWFLVALDADALRKSRVDAFASAQTTGGAKLPMTYEKSEPAAGKLSIRFLEDPKEARQQVLEIRFGGHRLSARVKPKV